MSVEGDKGIVENGRGERAVGSSNDDCARHDLACSTGEMDREDGENGGFEGKVEIEALSRIQHTYSTYLTSHKTYYFNLRSGLMFMYQTKLAPCIHSLNPRGVHPSSS